MSVAQEAKKAVENVYGTVYTVGSASNILCELILLTYLLTYLEIAGLNSVILSTRFTLTRAVSRSEHASELHLYRNKCQVWDKTNNELNGMWCDFLLGEFLILQHGQYYTIYKVAYTL